ncbi:MAG TPA: hypothetical protein VHN77_14705 [Phycisphaerales bacterium]|nr:hypothetical protein [Phycisphaerales bacterium]
MPPVARTYRLRRFDSPRDPDFEAAIGLYITNIGPSACTDSNDIVAWLERTYREYGDELCVLGFYVNRQLIGYSQCVLFRRERVLFFDYLVLHKEYRRQGEYFQFVERLQEWVDEQQFEFDFVVAEVAFETSGTVPSKQSVMLVDLFRRAGFHVADCQYWQPPLGINRPESDTRAHLLLAAREPVSVIRADTLLNVVHTVYFRHYQRWYDYCLLDDDAKAKYRAWLLDRYKRLQRDMEGRDVIALNGAEVLPEQVSKTRKPPLTRHPGVIAPLAALAAMVLVAVLFAILLSRLLPSAWSFIAAVVAALLCVVTAFAIFKKSAQRTLDAWLGVIKVVARRRK